MITIELKTKKLALDGLHLDIEMVDAEQFLIGPAQRRLAKEAIIDRLQAEMAAENERYDQWVYAFETEQRILVERLKELPDLKPVIGDMVTRYADALTRYKIAKQLLDQYDDARQSDIKEHFEQAKQALKAAVERHAETQLQVERDKDAAVQEQRLRERHEAVKARMSALNQKIGELKATLQTAAQNRYDRQRELPVAKEKLDRLVGVQEMAIEAFPGAVAKLEPTHTTIGDYQALNAYIATHAQENIQLDVETTIRFVRTFDTRDDSVLDVVAGRDLQQIRLMHLMAVDDVTGLDRVSVTDIYDRLMSDDFNQTGEVLNTRTSVTAGLSKVQTMFMDLYKRAQVTARDKNAKFAAGRAQHPESPSMRAEVALNDEKNRRTHPAHLWVALIELSQTARADGSAALDSNLQARVTKANQAYIDQLLAMTTETSDITEQAYFDRVAEELAFIPEPNRNGEYTWRRGQLRPLTNFVGEVSLDEQRGWRDADLFDKKDMASGGQMYMSNAIPKSMDLASFIRTLDAKMPVISFHDEAFTAVDATKTAQIVAYFAEEGIDVVANSQQLLSSTINADDVYKFVSVINPKNGHFSHRDLNFINGVAQHHV